MSSFNIKMIAGRFTIHRLEAASPIPPAVLQQPFFWIGRTDEELSIVCHDLPDIAHSRRSSGWACLKVLGPMDLSITGVLAGIAAVLAAAELSIFALSTFDTDYILVQASQLGKAAEALRQGGYVVDDAGFPA